jgi:type II secretory pathway pseudopilin PulG
VKFKNKNLENDSGITLIEILVVISIMILLSGILIADFPKIKRQFAITRSVYKMSQDIRRAQDMGFSGEQISDIDVKGYGVYVNLDRLGPKKYLIYADIDGDYRYTITTEVGDILCNDPDLETETDCLIETIDFSQAEPGVSITNILNTKDDKQEVDINFMPPNPTITITELKVFDDGQIANRVHITFSLDSDSSINRTVFVNTAGLIEIQ